MKKTYLKNAVLTALVFTISTGMALANTAQAAPKSFWDNMKDFCSTAMRMMYMIHL